MIRTNKWYEVISMEGTHGLSISCLASESFDSTIDAINEAVSRSKSLGYDNDEKWLIVETTVSRERSDDGMFLQDTTHRKTVAKYDNGFVTWLGEDPDDR